MQKGHCTEGCIEGVCAEGLSAKRSLRRGAEGCAEGLSAKRLLRGGSECKKVIVRRGARRV